MKNEKFEEISQEEIDEAVSKAKEKMKIDSKSFKHQRNAALTWNIIFFVLILTTTIVISILSKSETLNFKKFYINNLYNKIEIITTISGLIISFLIGILGSYFKTKKLTNETEFNIKDFLKETYLNRIDKSNLNPHRN